MIDAHDGVLAAHVVAGSLGLGLGAVAIVAGLHFPHRSSAGTAYHWAVFGVALSAVGLVAFDVGGLWWLIPLALLAYGLALLGYLAPHWRSPWWVRAYAHGQGGSYIALITAALVVSLDGSAAAIGWLAPTVIGLPLIERHVKRIKNQSRPEQEVVKWSPELARSSSRSMTKSARSSSGQA